MFNKDLSEPPAPWPWVMGLDKNVRKVTLSENNRNCSLTSKLLDFKKYNNLLLTVLSMTLL